MAKKVEAKKSTKAKTTKTAKKVEPKKEVKKVETKKKEVKKEIKKEVKKEKKDRSLLFAIIGIAIVAVVALAIAGLSSYDWNPVSSEKLNDAEKESIKAYPQGRGLFVCGSRRMIIDVVLTQDELDSFGGGGGL